LLVEDNPTIARTLGQAFRAIRGLEVVHRAATRREACAWLEANPQGWDLAVIDIFLAEGHGFDVLRSCGARDAAQKVVVLSNYTREPVRSSAMRLGADAVFDKSLELEDFMAYCGEFAGATAQQD
jgi:DNA-binding NarL/FixJ family response regulator